MSNRLVKPARRAPVDAEAAPETPKSDRLAAARRGGAASAGVRRTQAAKVEQFRAAVVARLGTLDPIQEAVLDSACALYLPLLRASRLNLGVNRKVNVLALSAAFTSLRAALRLLGAVDATAEDGAARSHEHLADLIDDGEKIIVTDNKL